MVRYDCQPVIRKRDPGILSLSAVNAAAQRPAPMFIRTVIDIASSAEKTFSAESLYIHRHPVPGLYLLYSAPGLHDPSDKFVSQDHTRDSLWHRVVFNVDVTGTDRRQRYLHDRILFILQRRHGALLQNDLSISFIYDCFHTHFLPVMSILSEHQTASDADTASSSSFSS